MKFKTLPALPLDFISVSLSSLYPSL